LRNNEVKMKAIVPHAGVDRGILLSTSATLHALLFPTGLAAQAQLREWPLDWWNEGPAKQTMIEFVRATPEPAGRTFVQQEERIAAIA
jgi:hypothetical protein